MNLHPSMGEDQYVSVGEGKTNNKTSIVYYESRKRELKIRLMNEGRCDERLKHRVEESTCLTDSVSDTDTG
jgi:hypothetical protein